jgi:hypothetical protein
MGGIDHIETLPAGTEVKEGDKLIELFHDNRSVVVESPFAGVVEGVNKQHGEDSEDAPLTAEWLCRVRPQDSSLLQETMLVGARAAQWLRREGRRLRVFLSTIAPQHPVLAQTMHDGGMPYAGLVEYLEDEDWKKLCDAFFDRNDGPSK